MEMSDSRPSGSLLVRTRLNLIKLLLFVLLSVAPVSEGITVPVDSNTVSTVDISNSKLKAAAAAASESTTTKSEDPGSEIAESESPSEVKDAVPTYKLPPHLTTSFKGQQQRLPSNTSDTVGDLDLSFIHAPDQCLESVIGDLGRGNDLRSITAGTGLLHNDFWDYNWFGDGESVWSDFENTNNKSISYMKRVKMHGNRFSWVFRLYSWHDRFESELGKYYNSETGSPPDVDSQGFPFFKADRDRLYNSYTALTIAETIPSLREFETTEGIVFCLEENLIQLESGWCMDVGVESEKISTSNSDSNGLSSVKLRSSKTIKTLDNMVTRVLKPGLPLRPLETRKNQVYEEELQSLLFSKEQLKGLPYAIRDYLSGLVITEMLLNTEVKPTPLGFGIADWEKLKYRFPDHHSAATGITLANAKIRQLGATVKAGKRTEIAEIDAQIAEWKEYKYGGVSEDALKMLELERKDIDSGSENSVRDTTSTKEPVPVKPSYGTTNFINSHNGPTSGSHLPYDSRYANAETNPVCYHLHYLAQALTSLRAVLEAYKIQKYKQTRNININISVDKRYFYVGVGIGCFVMVFGAYFWCMRGRNSGSRNRAPTEDDLDEREAVLKEKLNRGRSSSESKAKSSSLSIKKSNKIGIQSEESRPSRWGSRQQQDEKQDEKSSLLIENSPEPGPSEYYQREGSHTQSLRLSCASASGIDTFGVRNRLTTMEELRLMERERRELERREGL